MFNIVYTDKKFDDSEMVWKSCKTKLIWLKLEESDKIFEELDKTCAELMQKVQKSQKSCPILLI